MTQSLISSIVEMYPNVPFQNLLGIEVLDVSLNKAVVRMPFKPELTGGGNAYHGGAISSLLDLTGALASWSNHNQEKGMKASTVSLTVNYLSASLGKDLIATGEAVKRGKELIFCEVLIQEEVSGKAVANGTMIYRIV